MTLEEAAAHSSRYRPAYDIEPVAHYLYFLTDPRTPRRPRYIGVTKSPAERAKSHAKPFGGSQEFQQWKRELRADGLRPQLSVVASFPTLAAALSAEWRLMERWQRRGCDILSRVVCWSDEDLSLKWAGARASAAGALRRRAA